MALLLEEALAAEHFPCLDQWPVKTIAKKKPQRLKKKKKTAKKVDFCPRVWLRGWKRRIQVPKWIPSQSCPGDEDPQDLCALPC